MAMHVLYESQGGLSGELAALNPSNNFFSFTVQDLCHSGVKIDTDGILYRRAANGAWQTFPQGGTQWFVNGTVGSFYVNRDIVSGTLTTDEGAGWMITTSDRIYDVQRSSVGISTATIVLKISEDVSGSPISAQATYTFTAEVDSGL